MRASSWITRAATACVGLMLLSACGGAADEGDEAQTTTGGEAEPATAPAAWADMDREQRLAFMQETVVPEMRALFQEHDAERYAEFGCATCHGETMQDVDFAMPNGLAPLDPAQIPAMFQSEQPTAQFMVQTVWPRMAELLGEAPYDAETGQGFSCMNCHATAADG